MGEHNDVSWNAMISELTANGLHLEAFEYYMKMKERGFVPNKYTLVSVLKAVAMLGDVDKGEKVHLCVSVLGMEDNSLVGTALIDMYSKCGDLDKAKSVFNMHFAHRGVNAPWNAMISGFSLSKCSQETLDLYVKMCENNIKSDLYTYYSVFDSIANLKCLSFAKEVHSLVLKSGYDLKNPSVENAILDAYSKCGSFEEVKKIFDKMKCKDMVSWKTLVTAYSQSSKWEEALKIFFKMREEGFIPNHFTLASVLTACANLCYLEYGRQIHCLLCKIGCKNVRYIEIALIDIHAGLVEEGLHYFWSTERDYGLIPEMEHYACVVDLLGRVVLLSEAFEFITKMPVEPDEMVRDTLLAACRIHGNIELDGSVKDGIDLRKVMKRKGVRKEPGYSWISVEGRVHTFYAGGTSHARKDDIYAMLEELRRKMKALGYVPDLKYALQGED
ncbi:hypothetical protein RD792_013751 [Penstemon davidsonii]|uniref:Pentatricopeptide repeat-containing protein n=1 Tax=Penstemon davidsonii TaxID=160366 RepID=A0ABR0CVU7_9LAMI|nr:hypothetical protein RD792_013751 [Penstemon davidsonii]